MNKPEPKQDNKALADLHFKPGSAVHSAVASGDKDEIKKHLNSYTSGSPANDALTKALQDN